jgi:membrane-bound metal-dependent hydrolase YbcI (DUF457 family)
MALPIAHATAGYLVARAARRPPGSDRSIGAGWRAALFMFIGNLPDLDFLVGFAVGHPGLVHRGFSHTLLAAALFGVAAGAFVSWRGRERFGPAALAFGAAYGSHILLDWMTTDTRPPLGGQFLWPFSDAYTIAPVTMFSEIYLDGRTRTGFLQTVFSWPLALVLLREAAMAALAVGGWRAVEMLRARMGTETTLAREDLA